MTAVDLSETLVSDLFASSAPVELVLPRRSSAQPFDPAQAQLSLTFKVANAVSHYNMAERQAFVSGEQQGDVLYRMIVLGLLDGEPLFMSPETPTAAKPAERVGVMHVSFCKASRKLPTGGTQEPKKLLCMLDLRIDSASVVVQRTLSRGVLECPKQLRPLAKCAVDTDDEASGPDFSKFPTLFDADPKPTWRHFWVRLARDVSTEWVNLTDMLPVLRLMAQPFRDLCTAEKYKYIPNAVFHNPFADPERWFAPELAFLSDRGDVECPYKVNEPSCKITEMCESDLAGSSAHTRRFTLNGKPAWLVFDSFPCIMCRRHGQLTHEGKTRFLARAVVDAFKAGASLKISRGKGRSANVLTVLGVPPLQCAMVRSMLVHLPFASGAYVPASFSGDDVVPACPFGCFNECAPRIKNALLHGAIGEDVIAKCTRLYANTLLAALRDLAQSAVYGKLGSEERQLADELWGLTGYLEACVHDYGEAFARRDKLLQPTIVALDRPIAKIMLRTRKVQLAASVADLWCSVCDEPRSICICRHQTFGPTEAVVRAGYPHREALELVHHESWKHLDPQTWLSRGFGGTFATAVDCSRLMRAIEAALRPSCPTCGTHYVHDGGCVHMRCDACGTHFCHMCGMRYVGAHEPACGSHMLQELRETTLLPQQVGRTYALNLYNQAVVAAVMVFAQRHKQSKRIPTWAETEGEENLIPCRYKVTSERGVNRVLLQHNEADVPPPNATPLNHNVSGMQIAKVYTHHQCPLYVSDCWEQVHGESSTRLSEHSRKETLATQPNPDRVDSAAYKQRCFYEIIGRMQRRQDGVSAVSHSAQGFAMTMRVCNMLRIYIIMRPSPRYTEALRMMMCMAMEVAPKVPLEALMEEARPSALAFLAALVHPETAVVGENSGVELFKNALASPRCTERVAIRDRVCERFPLHGFE